MDTPEQGKRTCVFCGQGVVSNEHVWPKWIREEVALRYGNVKWDALRDGKVRSTPVLDAQVKRVCETCNNGWMSDLEGRAKPVLVPMMFGALPQISLSPEDQGVVALWAYKTVLMADFFGARRTLDPHVYTAFFRERCPPRRSWVLMAAYAGSAKRLRSYSTTTTVTREMQHNAVGVLERNPIELPAVIGTLVVFHLVLQVVIYSGKDLPLRVANGHAWEQMIWPVDPAPVTWPPNMDTLDEAALITLAMRRGTLRRSRKPHDPPIF
jgi:hypothetical protein